MPGDFSVMAKGEQLGIAVNWLNLKCLLELWK